MHLISDVIAALPSNRLKQLPAPEYTGTGEGSRVGLAVESMRTHTSNEGYELFQALEFAGYRLHGFNIGKSLTDVRQIWGMEEPAVVVAQDAREWQNRTSDRRQDPRAAFQNIECLRDHPDTFVVGLLKDAHQSPDYHRASFEAMGAHAVVCYYAPRIVHHLAPYLRPTHLIRTYHSIDPDLLPAYSPEGRKGCLLSGALSNAYPLRLALKNGLRFLPETTHIPHPGYQSSHCYTPEFLKTLSRYKVAICDSSRYGYALRKIIEAMAAGCTVITDLPADDILPEIDEGLIRVHPTISVSDFAEILRRELANYDPEWQEYYATKARRFYDYHAAGLRLAADIEALRKRYP